MLYLKSYNKHIIKKLRSRVLSLDDNENTDFEINEILRLLYILKHNLKEIPNKKKRPPVDGGGALQMSLSL
jgi:hypothetical protein